MKYMGGKQKIAKEILQIILKDRDWRAYVEPFVGGCNIIDKVDGNRVGCDINPYLISLWKAVSNGWMPPKEITEIDYLEIRNNKSKFPPELVGYVGFTLSFCGKWFGGWARGKGRDYVNEAYNSAIKQFPKLIGVEFHCITYYKLSITDSVIYCDPPYNGTTSYNGEKFNTERFWQWCRGQKQYGNSVFISEKIAPEDFNCVWEKQRPNSFHTKDISKQILTEKLFTI